MGANVADEVAMEKFCETTIGSSDPVNGELFRKLFHRDYFRVNVVQDVAGPELCGALKNVVALGAGFVDGLELGGNTKAAIMRIGLMEMKKFAETFYGGIKRTCPFFFFLLPSFSNAVIRRANVPRELWCRRPHHHVLQRPQPPCLGRVCQDGQVVRAA